MPVRVLGPDGSGTLDDVVAGVRWAVDHGAKVINLSLGDDAQALFGPAFGDVLREAWAKGVVPVVAAGNQFVTGSGFGDEPALVVAATDRNDAKPSYSSGVGSAKWGMAAPGGELPDLGTEGAVLSTYWDARTPNQYAYLAGTSQAAPHVAAAVAILLSTGRFTPQQAVQRLLDTAKDIGAAGRDATFGAGRLDLAAAVRGLSPAGTSAGPATGTPVPAPASAPATTAATPGAAPTTTAVAPTTIAPATTPTTAAVALGSSDVTGRREDGHDRTIPAAVAGLLILLTAAAGMGQRRRDLR
jgi:subtilisin family serine protease